LPGKKKWRFEEARCKATMRSKTIIAVCGKGGAGKTVLSGALVRALGERSQKNDILVVDADPATGLSYLLGLPADVKSLGNVRDELIVEARTQRNPDEIAGMIDYLLLEALYETERFSFLAMGRSRSKGCFCPLNTLLKASIRKLAQNYDVVVVDAEAGLEQIKREVMSFVDKIVVLIDNSRRSEHTMEIIMQMVSELNMKAQVGVVMNRWRGFNEDVNRRISSSVVPVWGVIPEDDQLLKNDAEGRSIFDLPANSPVLESARKVMEFLVSHREEVKT
jgi:CO dehydrogenase maturation factor